MRARLIGSVALACGLLAACSGQSESRPQPPANAILTGNIPLCYGPGPDLNLTPTRHLTVEQSGRLVTSDEVVATRTQHTYRLTLRPGTYDVRADFGLPTAHVTLTGGSTTSLDLPGIGCA